METLKDNLPIISAGLLIIGTINMIIYYSYFNIDILSFLDFTEVLQIQFKLFAIAGAIMIGLIMLVTAASFLSNEEPNAYQKNNFSKILRADRRKELLKSKNIVMPEEEIETTIKRKIIREQLFYERIAMSEQNERIKTFTYSKYKLEAIGLPVFLIPVLLPIFKNLSQHSIYVIHLVSIPLFAIFTSISYLGIRRDNHFNPTEPNALQKMRDLYKIACLFIFMTYAGGSYARASAINLLLDSSNYEVSFTIDNKNVITNKFYKYIGKTKNYIFFYDMTKKQSDIFKFDDVKNISIRDGMEYK